MHVGIEAEVDDVLAHAHGERRLVKQTFGVRVGFLHQVPGGHDMIDQADAPRFFGVDRLGVDDHLLGLGKADEVNHAVARAARRDAADVVLDQAVLGVVSTEEDVAGKR